jgi:ATP-dependent exoDNAse (exonuclease V) beta subunit
VLHQALQKRGQYPLVDWLMHTLKALHIDHILTPEQQEDLEQYWLLIKQYEQEGQLADLNQFATQFQTLYSKKVTPSRLQIMTIHKSKGLEYKVVIVPKFHFEFKGRNHEFWVDSPKIDHYLFQNKQKYSIKLSESTYNSHFGDQALKEESMLEIDNLNKIYVAITRAEERLYLIGVKPRLKKDHSGFAFYSMYFTNILYKVRYNNPSA